MENEKWKDIAGYEGHYQISNHGRVKSLDRIAYNGQSDHLLKGRILSSRKSMAGYNTVQLWKNNKGKIQLVHRLLAIHFILNPNPEIFDQVNHLDGNRANNNLSNLEWANNSTNQLHRYSVLGKKCAHKGQYNLAKFRPRPIMQLTKEGVLVKTYPSISEAKRQGFEPRNISLCLRGKVNSHKNYQWKYQ
jgi:hypothetical protein